MSLKIILRMQRYNYKMLNKMLIIRHFHAMGSLNMSCKKVVDNLTAVLHKKDDLRLEQRPVPEPKDSEVLLRMDTIGICGSDVHYWTHGEVGNFIVKEPMVVGHEASGIVDTVGQHVKNLKPGDRVAIEPGVPCRTCSSCKHGKYHLCPDIVFCATPPIHGNLARYFTHAADFCHKLPDHVSMEEGALLEPVSVAVHACRRANISIGDSVLILGAGPIGLATLLVAKAMGAAKVVLTDVVESRLEKAKELGADCVIDTKSTEMNVKDVILETMGGAPNKILDCCGTERALRAGIEVARAGGTVVLVGLAESDVKIPIIAAVPREITIKGSHRYCNDYPLALELVSSGKVKAKSLITHNYKLEDTLVAFEIAKTGRDNAIKVMIHANPDYTCGDK